VNQKLKNIKYYAVTKDPPILKKFLGLKMKYKYSFSRHLQKATSRPLHD
jgi:hypothetical protein